MTLEPLPADFLDRLRHRQEVLVGSREPGAVGRVRVWFAIAESGHLFLLTPSTSVKARRWLMDPWVSLTVPPRGPTLEAELELVDAAGALKEADLLVERFRMAGASTPEALGWLVESGSHLLLRVGLPIPD